MATSFLIDFLLGGVSGIIAKTSCAPLERIKVVLQTQASNPQINKDTAYKGIIDTAIRIPREQGLLSFWRGNATNCARYFPTQAINFACKEKYNSWFVRPRDQVGFLTYFAGNLLSGGLAGATSLTFCYPLDYSFTRLAGDVGKDAATRKYKGLADCLFKTFKADGLPGLYRGFMPSVFGIFVYRAGYFGLYDVVKDLLPKHENHYLQFSQNFATALIVDIFSSGLAYPFDTIRRRLMFQSDLPPGVVRQYSGSVDCARKIVGKEGMIGLFKGFGANSVRAIASALVLVLYGELKQQFGKSSKSGH